MTSVAGVLLAAGTSSRMGRNKLFLEWKGETLLRRAARTALAAGLQPLLVVLGHQSEAARTGLAGIDCSAVLNPDYARGMNGSLSAGIAALPETAKAAVVLLADMPLVTAEMIQAVLRSWKGEPLALSLYGAVVAPPILYARELFAELRALPPGGRGKEIVEQHRREAAEVAQPEAALRDLDVPADLERARNGE
jgi:molybdenum cofactor cytidylyltransferase